MTEYDEAAPVTDGESVASAVDRQPYRESEDHTPNPLDLTGHIDTTGTGGDTAQSAASVSPVFAQARAEALHSAVQAVENHPAGRPDSVVLPNDLDKSYDEALDDLRSAADAADTEAADAETGLTQPQVEAAQEGEPVNPNALTDDAHDYSVDGPTAPTTANASGVPVDNGTSATVGAPNVHPNADSIAASEEGDAEHRDAHVETDGTNV